MAASIGAAGIIPGVAWYKEWFGEEYLELYAHRDRGEAERHIDFVAERLAGETPRAVLDLACGAGRHTGALRRRGYRALGVDLSLTLLSQSPELPRVAGDMRCLPFADAAFDWVLNFFTSFGYFPTEDEDRRVLAEVVRVLAPAGRYLMDFLNRTPTVAGLVPRSEEVVDGLEVIQERWIDEARDRVEKAVTIRRPAASEATPRRSTARRMGWPSSAS